MDPVIAVVTAVLSALVGSIATTLYRDYRDRPVLSAFAEDFGIIRRPIALPEEISKELKKQGDFTEWGAPRVKWDLNKNISENQFSLRELHEINHLIPQFADVLKSHLESEKEQVALLSSGKQEEISKAFSLLRNIWYKRFKEDIAVAYKDNPDETIERAITNTQGDINQIQDALDGLLKVHSYLNAGLSPDAPAANKINPNPELPTDPKKPFVIVDIMIMNTGKTDTLIQGGATLIVGNKSFPLEGITESRDFSVFSGKYWRINKNTVAQTSFSQSPTMTNISELEALSELIKDRSHNARIELKDFAGNTIKTGSFKLKDNQT